MNMKKIVLAMLAVAVFPLAFAQDTLTMFDTFYMHRPIDENLTPVDCKYFVTANNQRERHIPHFQMYEVTTPTTLYGVAVTPYFAQDKYNWDSVYPDAALTAIVFAKDDHGYYAIVDSVRCNITPYRANFWYQYLWGESPICDLVEVREFYFDHPCTVYDTCFVGVRLDYIPGSTSRHELNYATDIMSTTTGGCYILAKNERQPVDIYTHPCDRFTLVSGIPDDSCEFVVSLRGPYWGGSFPIVGFHCTTPPQNIRRVEITPDHCVMAWDGGTDSVYEVVVGTYGATPDSISRRYITTDTTIILDSLEYGTLYSFWVRGQCRYTTAAYDTVIWSNWGSTYISLPLSVEEAATQWLEVTPNPTEGPVHIDAEDIREVWCISADGRRSRLKVRDGQVSLSDYPAGLYVLEVQTGGGVYTVRVVRR